MSAPCAPTEVPEIRARLIDGWDKYRTWWDLEYDSFGFPSLIDQTDWYANILATTIKAHKVSLTRADLFWVGEEMCDLLYQTTAQVPDDTEPENLIFPAKTGFVVFAKPWIGHDTGDGHKIYIDAVHWDQGTIGTKSESDSFAPGVNMTFYVCVDFDNPRKLEEAPQYIATNTDIQNRLGISEGVMRKRLTGKVWAPLGRSTWTFGESIVQELESHKADEVEIHIKFSKDIPEGMDHMILDPDTGSFYPADGDTTNRGKISNYDVVEKAKRHFNYLQSIVEDRRLLSALFTLLDTHSVSQTREEYVPRAIARRLNRGNPKAEVPSVKVVYLRRPKHDAALSEHSSESSYSHRWVVSAHMRNQPYGPGNSLRKLILIPSHVKGPDDAPLVVKDTVRAWVR